MTRRNLFLLIGIALAGLAFDQLTKLWVIARLQTEGNSMRVIGDFIIFVLTYNPRGIFGISFGNSYAYLLLPLFGILLVIVFARTSQHRGYIVSYGLILGGAFGNLIDRFLRPQGVVDFISAKFIHFRVGTRWFGLDRWYTFNIADSLLLVGILLLLLLELLTMLRHPAPRLDSGASADGNPPVPTGS